MTEENSKDEKQKSDPTILKDGFWNWLWWRILEKGRKVGDE